MGTFSKYSHKKFFFKRTKNFTETLDMSKADVKENIYSHVGPFQSAKFQKIFGVDQEIRGCTVIFQPKWPIYP